MLSSKYRFHSRGGVKYTYQKGKTIRTPKLSLVFAPNKKQKQRYAVVVSKKVLKTAVGRNRIRRRLYEAIRLGFDPSLKLDCIFVIYSKDFVNMDFNQIKSLVKELLEKAKIEAFNP